MNVCQFYFSKQGLTVMNSGQNISKYNRDVIEYDRIQAY